MPGSLSKSVLVFVAFAVALFLWGEVALAKDKGAIMLFPSAGSKKTQGKSDKALPEIPEDPDKAKIHEIMAGLSDDQVRRLLIHELELAAEGQGGWLFLLR